MMPIPARAFALAAASVLSLAAIGASAMAPRSGELRESECFMLDASNGRAEAIQRLDLHVLRDTARSGRFQLALRPGIVGLMCTRNDILPAAHDDEVVWLGIPFHISQSGRLGVLEIVEGRFRFRLISGRLRPEERRALDARLAEFQARFPPTS